MERRALRRLALVGLLLGVGGAVVLARRRGGDAAVPVPAPAPPAVDATAPAGVRIKVEVLNATRQRGLARRAMLHLRARGFDVVSFASASETRDSTIVLDRSGHPEWAKLVAQALGGARVEARPDSSRYLDVTVLLGATWRAPAEPFNP